jgi:hypothetical protein
MVVIIDRREEVDKAGVVVDRETPPDAPASWLPKAL